MKNAKEHMLEYSASSRGSHEKEKAYDCTRRNIFSCDVVFRLNGGTYVTNE